MRCAEDVRPFDLEMHSFVILKYFSISDSIRDLAAIALTHCVLDFSRSFPKLILDKSDSRELFSCSG